MSPISLPGRPEGAHGSAQHEGTSASASDPSFAPVLRELAARGLTDAASASTDDEAGADSPERPWFIGLLLGASGWLAGLFVLVFVAVLLQLGSPTTAGGAGALLLAAAWAMFMADREGAFTGQLALALSIAGQCLVLYAMNSPTLGLGPLAASTLLLQAALVLVMPNPLHRTLSTFFATIAWALTVRFVLLGEADPWHGADSGGASAPWAHTLVGWSLAWLPVLGGIALAIRRELVWMARDWQPLMRPALTGLILGLAFATLASQPFDASFAFAAAPTGSNARAFWPLLSAVAALGGVAAGFALRSRALMSACAVGALLHLSYFYYVLGASLLQKSALMLSMGGAMLLAAHGLTPRKNR